MAEKLNVLLRRNQRLVFFSIFFGYAFYVLCRKSFSFIIPQAQAEEKLSKEDLGTIVSSLNLAYAISKFVLGILSDHISAKFLFCSGLISSALSVVGFSQCTNVPFYSLLWFANGLAQGCGWPACSKLLRKWFRRDEFGTWWSVLAASMNVTGVAVPLLLPFLLIVGNGWRGFMLFSGLVSMVWSAICLYFLHNSPEEIGLSPVEMNDQVKGTKNKYDKKSTNESARLSDLLSSPFLWLLSLYYMIVFASKTSCENWAQLLIVDDKKMTPTVATQFISAFETGGMISSFTTGYLTDIIVSKLRNSKGNPRMVLAIVYMAISLVSLHLLTSLNAFLPILAFLLGASLYGNINIFGIVATEAAPLHLSGTSHAIVSLAANIGAVLAGYPFSVLAHSYGWSGVFVLLKFSCLLCFLLSVLTRNVNGKIAHKED